uniref:Uncharacterized protein n=1 Tax=Tetraselmis chuii TaxID=63592 RepID=A0A7S1XAC1_9CHLO|mmetsp:Transcript_5297/g.9533  ORF Transcript_5297/g.9533 Transcript_5297/m.9533 type:complete len:416 (+) Transcript_5297:661-1908(+)
MGCACSLQAQVSGEAQRSPTRDELRELYRKSLQVNKGRLIVGGLLHRANSVNNNRRMYPKSILKREVDRYQRTHIRHGTALGELDHPSYVSPTFRSLNLMNVSHQVLEAYWEGDSLMGVIEVLPTPAGRLLMDLFREGCQVGVSSRGWASLREANGCITVQNDFELITFDFVTEPSTQGAFLRPLDVPYRWKVDVPYCRKMDLPCCRKLDIRYPRKRPDQSRTVALSHLASARAGPAETCNKPSGGVLPPAEMILPMCGKLGGALEALASRHLPHVEEEVHPWVVVLPTKKGGDPSGGRSMLQQINARGSVEARLPPHPTKAGWASSQAEAEAEAGVKAASRSKRVEGQFETENLPSAANHVTGPISDSSARAEGSGGGRTSPVPTELRAVLPAVGVDPAGRNVVISSRRVVVSR